MLEVFQFLKVTNKLTALARSALIRAGTRIAQGAGMLKGLGPNAENEVA